MESDEIEIPDKRELERSYETQFPRYEAILGELEGRVKLCLDPLGIHPTLKTRIKSFRSYFKKLLKLMQKAREEGAGTKPLPITDILGMRIVCPFIEDLKRVEDAILRSFEVTEIERKGSNLSFKEFGYESTHLLVRIPADILKLFPVSGDLVFEIQIRTILQDAWAEVEHELVYKAEFNPYDEPMKRKLAALNANLSLSDIIFQEIRDYQHKLNNELMLRRAAFFGKIEAATDGTLCEAEAAPAGVAASAVVPAAAAAALPESGTVGGPLPGASASGPVEAALEGPAILGTAAEDILKGTAPGAVSGTQPEIENGEEVSIDDQLLQALYAHNRNDYDRAIAIYSHILERDPKIQIQAIIFIHRGMAHFAKSAYDAAIADFSRALELNPTNHKAAYYRAVVYSVQEQYARAISDFNLSLEVNPFQYFALFRRGQAFYHLGDYTKALSDCEKALDLEPDSRVALKFKELVLEKLRM